MTEIVEDVVICIVALAVIALTGWVFYLTRNPFSFLIPFVMPMLRSNRGKRTDGDTGDDVPPTTTIN